MNPPNRGTRLELGPNGVDPGTKNRNCKICHSCKKQKFDTNFALASQDPQNQTPKTQQTSSACCHVQLMGFKRRFHMILGVKISENSSFLSLTLGLLAVFQGFFHCTIVDFTPEIGPFFCNFAQFHRWLHCNMVVCLGCWGPVR